MRHSGKEAGWSRRSGKGAVGWSNSPGRREKTHIFLLLEEKRIVSDAEEGREGVL